VASAVKRCSQTGQKLQRALRPFLRAYGDIPAEEVAKATTDLKKWFTLCDEKDTIVAAGRYEDNDWYLCTLKNIATHPDFRRRGLGGEVVDALLKKTFSNKSCLVLAGDITYNNIGSKRIFKKRGFEEVNRFCWGEGEAAADILHLVRFPAKGDKCPTSYDKA
jgi:predicted GNAT family acetyltransferase|tara:strand:+ start:529 stop:1017 length:489 start_codon:yes stop_codon:yes gene_type:complete